MIPLSQMQRDPRYIYVLGVLACNNVYGDSLDAPPCVKRCQLTREIMETILMLEAEAQGCGFTDLQKEAEEVRKLIGGAQG